jgi:hypothetical protein
MTIIGNVTLNSVVYYPSARNQTTGFVWVDRTSGYPNGQGLLSYSGPVSKGTNTKRVGFRLDLPTVATADDTCACAGDLVNSNGVTIYVDVDTRSSVAQRTDLVARITSLVASGVFVSAVENLDGVY